MEKIALYTLCNDSYSEPVSVMISSFLMNNKWFDGDIIVLCDGGDFCKLSDNNRAFISSLYRNVIFREVDSSKYKKIFENCKKNGSDLKRCFLYYKLETFIKDDYDVKVFLDGDIVVNKEIKELFANMGNDVLVVKDCVILLSDYFNSGVMSIPMKAIADDFYDRLIEFSEACDDSSFKNPYSCKGGCCDQDVLNELLENKRYIDLEYNFCPKSYPASVKMPWKDAKIIHYYGWEKPWQSFFMAEDSFLPYFKYFYIIFHIVR